MEEKRWKIVEMHLLTRGCPLTVREYARCVRVRGTEADRLLRQWLGNPYSKEILGDVFRTVQAPVRGPSTPPPDQTILEQLNAAIESENLLLLRPIVRDASAAADPEILSDQARDAARAKSAASAGQNSQSKKTWIEFKLVDQDGDPVRGARYRLKITDGSVREGSLDDSGIVRVNGLDPGTCEISFLDYDRTEWHRL